VGEPAGPAGGGPPLAGRDPEEILRALAPRSGPDRLLDLMLRSGPYGDAFGANPGGLSLAALEAQPHGVDLGPLEPRIPEVLRTPSGRIELAPDGIVAHGPRPCAARTRRHPELVLVGRRHLRSNNSWMHNVENLVRGRDRCTLQLHPDDAAAHGLVDGTPARVRSRTGTVVIPVEITAGIMRGVASIPHGWGHDEAGPRPPRAPPPPGGENKRPAAQAGGGPPPPDAPPDRHPLTTPPPRAR